jgi:mannonate dehydratase
MPKIIAAKTIVTCPGRNFVTLKIDDHEGVYGIGDATLNGRELAVESLSHRARHPLPDRPRRPPDRGHLAVPVQGRLLAARPGDHGRHRRGRHGAVGHQGQDRRPAVYQLLGGACRTGVMVYGHANGETIEETLDNAAHYAPRATRPSACRPGCRACRALYGVSKDKFFYEPADGDLPKETVWSTERYLRTAPTCSRRPASGWAGTCTCCTTSTTA